MTLFDLPVLRSILLGSTSFTLKPSPITLRNSFTSLFCNPTIKDISSLKYSSFTSTFSSAVSVLFSLFTVSEFFQTQNNRFYLCREYVDTAYNKHIIATSEYPVHSNERTSAGTSVVM